ncbi:hypothetical protein RHECNPAF_35000139 [Rhizobium etli CNPAF512]|nr:hypothetical protein RHECNPAF_35000139 [Rhizobium etli CNPAF512]
MGSGRRASRKLPCPESSHQAGDVSDTGSRRCNPADPALCAVLRRAYV